MVRGKVIDPGTPPREHGKEKVRAKDQRKENKIKYQIAREAKTKTQKYCAKALPSCMTPQSHVKILFFYTKCYLCLSPLSLFSLLFLESLSLSISLNLHSMPHSESKMGEPIVNGEKHSHFLDVCTTLTQHPTQESRIENPLTNKKSSI